MNGTQCVKMLFEKLNLFSPDLFEKINMYAPSLKKKSWNFILCDRNKNAPSKLIATHFECTNSRHDARQYK